MHMSRSYRLECFQQNQQQKVVSATCHPNQMTHVGGELRADHGSEIVLVWYGLGSSKVAKIFSQFGVGRNRSSAGASWE